MGDDMNIKMKRRPCDASYVINGHDVERCRETGQWMLWELKRKHVIVKSPDLHDCFEAAREIWEDEDIRKPCGRVHYPGNDPENGPATACALDTGHDGFHQGAEELHWERESVRGIPDAECTECGERFWSGDAQTKFAICSDCLDDDDDDDDDEEDVPGNWCDHCGVRFENTPDEPVLVEGEGWLCDGCF
jgi:hypothetical protein